MVLLGVSAATVWAGEADATAPTPAVVAPAPTAEVKLDDINVIARRLDAARSQIQPKPGGHALRFRLCRAGQRCTGPQRGVRPGAAAGPARRRTVSASSTSARLACRWPRLPTYAIANISVVQKLDLGIGRGTEARLDVLNVTDAKYEIRDGTGVGVGAPQYGLRRAVLAGLTQKF